MQRSVEFYLDWNWQDELVIEIEKGIYGLAMECELYFQGGLVCRGLKNRQVLQSVYCVFDFIEDCHRSIGSI
jgi:hypothetical protein